MYVCKFNVLVMSDKTSSDETLDLMIENQVSELLKKELVDVDAELISISFEDIVGENWGRCEKCGAWTTDNSKPDNIDSFSPGANVNGRWLCDLCLPEGHPNRF